MNDRDQDEKLDDVGPNVTHAKELKDFDEAKEELDWVISCPFFLPDETRQFSFHLCLIQDLKK